MFCLKTFNVVEPKMSKYIKEQTNNSMAIIEEKYSNKNKSDRGLVSGTRVFDLVKSTDINLKMPSFYFILPFVSLLSLLAGYKIHNLIQK